MECEYIKEINALQQRVALLEKRMSYLNQSRQSDGKITETFSSKLIGRLLDKPRNVREVVYGERNL